MKIVSNIIARLAQLNGFMGECDKFLGEQLGNKIIDVMGFMHNTINNSEAGQERKGTYWDYKVIATLPTQSQLLEWFEETHGIYVEISPNYIDDIHIGWAFVRCFYLEYGVTKDTIQLFQHKSDAINVGLEKAFKLLNK